MLFLVGSQALALAADPIPEGHRVSVWPEYNDNQALFMQGVFYAPTTPLPIEVKMAIPKGASVVWAGELAGTGDPAQDVQATPKINPKADYDEVVFTLTKHRAAQVEAKLLNAFVKNGQERNLTLNWTQQYPTKETVFMFRAPSQTSDIKMNIPENPASVSQKAQGYYETQPMVLAVGQKQVFNVTYKRSTDVPTANDLSAQAQQGQTGQQQGAPAAPAGGGSSNVALILLGAIGVAVVAFVLYTKSKHGANESAYEDSEPVAKKAPAKSQAKSSAQAKPAKSQASDVELAKAARRKVSMVAAAVAVIVVGVAISGAVVKSSEAPTGENCGQNIEYLQKGVDKYKEAHGVYPTDLKQLLEAKDGKGPFAEKVDYVCPTEGAPYEVVNGVVQQVSQ